MRQHAWHSRSNGPRTCLVPVGLPSLSATVPHRSFKRGQQVVAASPSQVAVELLRHSVDYGSLASGPNPVFSTAQQMEISLGTAIGQGLLVCCFLAPAFVGFAYVIWDKLLEGRVFRGTGPQLEAQDDYMRRDVVRRTAALAEDVLKKQSRRVTPSNRRLAVDVARTAERLVALRRPCWDKEQDEAVAVAALLHASLDGAFVTPDLIIPRFGQRVADIMDVLARLTDTAQLLRCRLSFGARDELRSELEPEKVREVNAVHGARLIKLAGRLHLMRGLWQRPLDERCAVASETLQVWVPLAERARVWGLKSELEDLSFAILHPEVFDSLQAQTVRLCEGPRDVTATEDNSAIPQPSRDHQRSAAPHVAPSRAAPAHPPSSKPPSQPLYVELSPASVGIGEPRRPGSPSHPVFTQGDADHRVVYADTPIPEGSLRPAYAERPPKELRQASMILPVMMSQAGGRVSLSRPTTSPALAHAAVAEEQIRSASHGLTEPLSARQTVIGSVARGVEVVQPTPLSGRVPMHGEVAGSRGPYGYAGGPATGVRLESSQHFGPPTDFWKPRVPGDRGGPGRQGLHVHQLGFAKVEAFDPDPQTADRDGPRDAFVSSLRQWFESIGALPVAPVDQGPPKRSSFFRGRFLSDGDQRVQLEAEGETRRDGCVVWKFPQPEPVVPVPNDEQLPVYTRIKAVIPFDELTFALDLPSKEKAEPSRMLRAARQALRTLPRVGGLGLPRTRLGGPAASPGSALCSLSMDSLADEPESRLALLKRFARQLLKELRIEGVLSGVDVRVVGRVKSLYSTHRKMVRKGVPFEGVYDGLALRIVVDDSEGSERQAAVQACYSILPAIHRLWSPVPQEFDDYIIKPKASGYQSLHTTVMVGDVPLEVQVRTRSMDLSAEDGKAAHGYYKDSVLLTKPSPAAPVPAQVRLPEVGDSVMKVSGRSDLQTGVVVRVDQEHKPHRQVGSRRAAASGRPVRVGGGGTQRDIRLLVAVHTRSTPLQGELKGVSEDSRKLADLVAEKGWWHPGHGNFEVKLETYRLCDADSQYHFVDQYGRMGPAVVKMLRWDEVVEAFRLPPTGRDNAHSHQPRVHKLRKDLAAAKAAKGSDGAAGGGVDSSGGAQVTLLLFLSDDLVRAETFPAGTTAGNVLSTSRGTFGGPDGACVLVNNQWVDAETQLQDGDLVALSGEAAGLHELEGSPQAALP